MEPVSTGVAKVGGEALDMLKKESESFLSTVLGEPAKALGGLLADKVNRRRHLNLIKITVEAKRQLSDAGVSPKEVPLKIIHPLLESAALEDDPDLQTIWASLLANAADPHQVRPVLPSFPVILKELGVPEVKFLTGLYENSLLHVGSLNQIGQRMSVADIDYPKDQLLKLFGNVGLSRTPDLSSMTEKYYQENSQSIEADFRDFELLLSVVRRNGLVEEATHIPPVPIPTPDLYDSGNKLKIDLGHTYRFSHFGTCFMSACHRPTAKP